MYAKACAGRPGGVTAVKDYPQFNELKNIYAFGEDKDGELLILDANGNIYRLVAK